MGVVKVSRATRAFDNVVHQHHSFEPYHINFASYATGGYVARSILHKHDRVKDLWCSSTVRLLSTQI